MPNMGQFLRKDYLSMWHNEREEWCAALSRAPTRPKKQKKWKQKQTELKSESKG